MSSRPKNLRAVRAEGAGQSPQLPLVWQLMGEEGLPQRLLVLAKMIERVTSRQLQAEFALSLAQWRVLAFICINGPATATFIGESAEVDQAEISRAVKSLRDRGIVTREYEPGSRKTLVIAPTEQGQTLFAQVRQHRRAYFARVTGGLAAGEKAEFDRMLAIMGERVVLERSRELMGG